MELWTSATQNEAAVDRLWLAWQHLEKATNLIDENDLGFTFPVEMLMKHYRRNRFRTGGKSATDALRST